MSLIGKFYRQLKLRGVVRAAIAYAVGAWALVEFSGVLADAFSAPDWLMPVLIGLVIVGLPIVLAFSWFFDITPDGIRRTQTVEEVVPNAVFDRRVTFVVISLLLAALLLSVYGNFRQAPEPPESMSILIADFENEAGNELFSGIIEESLRVGLEVAPFVSTFSRKRAADIAGVGGALPLEAAGIVALREGINIAIGGTISRDGGELIVSASGFAPGDSTERFKVTRRAKTDADILNVVAQIAKALRLELGDTQKPIGAGEAESFVVANLEAASEYLKAQDLQFSRKLEEAVVHYEKAIEFDPKFARAYAGLALTELYLGRTESASKHWELALAGLNTLTERGQLRTLGNYYFSNQQDYDKALETYERLVERYPVDNVAQNNLAVAAFYALDFDRAFEVGRVVADRYADRSAFAANLALYAMYASNFDEARSVADKVIELDPVNAYANFVIAQTQAMAEEWPAVESTYKTMQAHDQFARSVAAEGLADLALYRGDTGKALQTLEKAIDAELALNALNTVALKHTMRADAYLLVGDNEQALEATAAALEIEANDPAVLVPAALAFIELSQFEKAEEIITTLSDGFSKSRRAYGQALRANLASKQGDMEAAIEAANAAIELADLWLIRLVRAGVLLKADRLTDAQTDLLDCEARTGEGIAVFLNDRPSLRFIRQLEALRNTADTT